MVEKGGRKGYITEGMEEAPENGKESSHSAHANGTNECNQTPDTPTFRNNAFACPWGF